MTAIPTARHSKTNWMNTHVKHCSRLNDKSFDTILIVDSLIAGLARYSKVWNKFFKPLNAFNCGIGGDNENVQICDNLLIKQRCLYYINTSVSP